MLLDHKGKARVCDFGLVSAGAETIEDNESFAGVVPTGTSLDVTLTRTGDILGTPLYMAPEQHRGEAANAKSDQFAFSVALYEALYGSRPFRGTTHKELVTNVLDGDLMGPPRDPDVPAWLRPILLRGLAVDPDKRYPSMEAMLADLERDPAAVRKRRSAIAGIVAVITALVGVAGYALMTRSIAPDPPIGKISGD